VRRLQPWWLESHNRGSGKPGAIHKLDCLSKTLKHAGLSDVVVSEAVSPQHAPTFEQFLKRLSRWEAWNLENTGRFASLNSLVGLDQAAADLTKKQQRDFDKQEYRSYVSIHVPGTIPKKKSNRVMVNGDPTTVPDYLLPLLLRLVVELKRRRGGWVNMEELSRDHVVNAPDDHRWYSRLRSSLGAGLPRALRKRLIENDGAGNYRLSTHPDFATYDRRKLMGHPKADVRKMAALLSNSRRLSG